MAKETPPDAGDLEPHSPSTLEVLGTHPLGTVIGLIGGGVTGALVGLAAGPVGSLVGAVGGAVLGVALGTAGDVGPLIDVGPQDRYWRENFASRPYVPAGADYADYGPAYRLGAHASLAGGHGRDWAEVETNLAHKWSDARGDSKLVWVQALPAVRDAWERAQETG